MGRGILVSGKYPHGPRRPHLRGSKSSTGGWNGWRDFRIENVARESSVISSFILRPVDGQPVMEHKPGQYLTFSFEIDGQPAVKRNYSISSAANGETYRISVKREPKGVASNWLHDHATVGTVIKVAAPAGEFFWRNGQCGQLYFCQVVSVLRQ